MNYKEDLAIDENNLHIELAKNPLLFSKWAEALVNMENQRDRLRDRLELIHAELDNDIRSNPEKYSLGQVTEKLIQSTILMHEDYRKVKEEYLKAKHEAGILKVAVRSFKSREKSLERLVRLYNDNYYLGTQTKPTPTTKPKDDADVNGAANVLDAVMSTRKKIKEKST
jgi:hypothetical protein